VLLDSAARNQTVLSVRFLHIALAAGIVASVTVPLRAQPLVCEDGRVTRGGDSFGCLEVDLLSRVSLAEMSAHSGNDSWGWTDPESGREYGLMGLNNGTFFIDVTEPTNPVLLGKLPTQSVQNFWRDVKVYEDHAFVVSEAAGHGMQVFDLRRLRGLASDPHRTFVADAVFSGGDGPPFFRAHNVAINEETGRAYVVGARDNNNIRVCQGGLYIIDISEPAAPEFAGCFADDGYTHDVQCVIYRGPDEDYSGREICFASNENTVTIVDVTDRMMPRPISQVLYPNTGYTHQGWLSEDHRYFFVNDEQDEVSFNQETRTIILDVTNLENADYLGSYFHGTPSITHNLYIRDGFLFAANYTTGLRILDLRAFLATGSIDHIQTVGYFDTHPENDDRAFRGAWSNYPFFKSGVVIVSDIDRGLFVVRPTRAPVTFEPVPESGSARMELFPNPVRNALWVSLSVPGDRHVRLDVFDLLGRRVAALFEGVITAGLTHELSFSLPNLPAGAYIVRAVGDGFVLSQQISRLH
jgi:choice-of-anchor B domain-containing protein